MKTGERPAVAVWTVEQTATFLSFVAQDRLAVMWWLFACAACAVAPTRSMVVSAMTARPMPAGDLPSWLADHAAGVLTAGR